MPYVIGRPGQIELKPCVQFTERSAHFVFGHLTAAECAVPSGLSQRLCCWLFQLERRGSCSCLSDTAFAYYSLTGDLSSSTMQAKQDCC